MFVISKNNRSAARQCVEMFLLYQSNIRQQPTRSTVPSDLTENLQMNSKPIRNFRLFSWVGAKAKTVKCTLSAMCCKWWCRACKWSSSAPRDLALGTFLQSTRKRPAHSCRRQRRSQHQCPGIMTMVALIIVAGRMTGASTQFGHGCAYYASLRPNGRWCQSSVSLKRMRRFHSMVHFAQIKLWSHQRVHDDNYPDDPWLSTVYTSYLPCSTHFSG